MSGRQPDRMEFLSTQPFEPEPAQKVENSYAKWLMIMFSGILLPFVVSLGTYQIEKSFDQVDRVKSSFVDEARTFDAVSTAYVQAVLNNSSSRQEAASKVLVNLSRQSQLLDDVEPHLSPADRRLAAKYQSLLVKFHDAVPDTANVLNMQAFWTEASELEVTRNALIRKVGS